MASPPRQRSRVQEVLHEVIFEADTARGKVFDLALLVLIVVSVLAVMLETVVSLQEDYGDLLRALEWIVTIVFTVEYILRLSAVDRPLSYVFSFYGVVDLLSIIPTYISTLIPGTQSLLVIRALRLLRVFRVLKLGHFLLEEKRLSLALKGSFRKIIIFLATVLMVVLIMGALMYLIEGEENGFTSIPRAVYWAVVTMTTVGYGDIAPHTVLGQFFAATLMIMGYGIIAVPTGIVSVELAQVQRKVRSTKACQTCSREGHDDDAKHCKFCGAPL